MLSCQKCNAELLYFYPSKCKCGYTVPIVDGVYQFTEDKAISTARDGLMWLGYENVGVNYKPGFAASYNDGDFGMFGVYSRRLSKLLGQDKIVLDLGAGLGQASIPLAISGTKTIAADISQIMLSVLYKRALKYNILESNLICARMNAYNIKLSDSSVDAVMEIDMLHQVNRPNLVINEAKRVLKPDGIYVRYSNMNLQLTDEQKRCNNEGKLIEKDISNYNRTLVNSKIIKRFDTLPDKADNPLRPFESWEAATKSISDNFYKPKIIETDEIQNWQGDVNFMLHKLKTRASGGAQLIPDDIHTVQ
jgi:ubiquinone/menaquinone biosynthesis C-methylase UbiE